MGPFDAAISASAASVPALAADMWKLVADLKGGTPEPRTVPSPFACDPDGPVLPAASGADAEPLPNADLWNRAADEPELGDAPEADDAPPPDVVTDCSYREAREVDGLEAEGCDLDGADGEVDVVERG